MKVFLAAVLFLGIAVVAMCFNIIFRKKPFPNSDVGTNPEMRRLGIRCYREEDDALHRRVCTGNFSDACKDCGLYKK